MCGDIRPSRADITAQTAILAKDLLGGDTLAGLAFAGSTFGSAAAAVPLSRRTAARGRRAGMVWGYSVGAVTADVDVAITGGD